MFQYKLYLSIDLKSLLNTALVSVFSLSFVSRNSIYFLLRVHIRTSFIFIFHIFTYPLKLSPTFLKKSFYAKEFQHI